MDESITKDDLRQFRMLLLGEIRELLSSAGQESSVSDADTDENTNWLRSKAIRKILDISPGTLQNLRVQGKVRFRKVMGSYYYNRIDIVNLFNEG